MLKCMKIAVLILMPCLTSAQSVSVAPQSIPRISTPGFTEISFSAKGIGIHYFFNRMDTTWNYYPIFSEEEYRSKVTRHAVGLSYIPINISDIVRLGGMVTSHKFPISKGRNFHFLVDIGYSFDKIRISWTHMSGGFGLLTRYNPSYDTIKVTYHF